MNMNLPNKLTLLRVILVVPFVVFLLNEPANGMFKWAALVIFIIASLTDMLDGQIARKYNLVTNFGKFADPLADKMLVSSALICLSVLGWVPAWITIIIIVREFIISGFRLIAAEQGKVIAASWCVKWKTAVTMIAVIFHRYLINPLGVPGAISAGAESAGQIYVVLCTIALVLFWISMILTVISLVDYIYKNREVLKN